MTLADQMRDDVSNVFLNSDEHAETIVSQSVGGTSKSILAIVNREAANLFVAVSDGQQERRQATLYIATDPDDGVESIVEGHVFKFDDHTWKVATVSQNDGFGMQTVVVYRDVQSELGTQEYWRQR